MGQEGKEEELWSFLLVLVLIGYFLAKYMAADQDNDIVLSFLQFEDKSDAVFDITEKCKYSYLFI